jgi:hypothetical protein
MYPAVNMLYFGQFNPLCYTHTHTHTHKILKTLSFPSEYSKGTGQRRREFLLIGTHPDINSLNNKVLTLFFGGGSLQNQLKQGLKPTSQE